MDKKLLVMLACPLCQGKLVKKKAELICRFDRLAYPIRDGIPVMIEQESRTLSIDEKNDL